MLQSFLRARHQVELKQPKVNEIYGLCDNYGLNKLIKEVTKCGPAWPKRDKKVPECGPTQPNYDKTPIRTSRTLKQKRSENKFKSEKDQMAGWLMNKGGGGGKGER